MDLIAREGTRLMATHVAAAAHLFALVAAVLLLVWTIRFGGGIALHSSNKERVLNVHPVVMFMGFIFVAGEAIMAFKIIRAPKKLQKLVHMALQLVALGLGSFGVYAAFKYHRESHIPDMTSLHSWLGMATICLVGLQWIFGFLLFWFPGAPRPARVAAAPLHACAGVALFLMTICTAETGLAQRAAEPGMESRLLNFAGLFILLFGVVVSLSVALPRLTVHS
ncbi:unnamed protein product [Spirodela intermedia]|uniref:Cytochrome b561 domain-containing protein n=1 Tax=Spirodela intermedia TaxID=51605 RepID=A0A7I8J3E3_SPIIN|nr:unnamed protein product [Spirodela intermedia]CAA6664778.1 unnamed protein product [Spirodela intermedia]